MAEKIWRLEVLAGESDSDVLPGLLALHASFGWEEQGGSGGGTLFRLHCENDGYLRDLEQKILALAPAAMTVLEEVENPDWTDAWREFFTPVCCGSRFVVLPPWLADADSGPRQKILIEPKSAFGTGHHATTALCLAALSGLLDTGELKAPGQFLDLGCGSGILGIAASLGGFAGLGLDIDPLAIANALENRELNHADSLELAEGGIELAAGKNFDLVMANILAGPLVEMAPQITASVKEGGILVLSGILESQADRVERAYMDQGLPEARRLEDGEWRALIFSRVPD